SETLIEIQARELPGVLEPAADARAEDNALHHVRSSKAPGLRGEHDVVGAVNLAPVIPGVGLTGERQPICATPILDLEEPFRDVDVRRAIFAHGAELQEVSLQSKVTNGEHEVEGRHDVVHLDTDSVLTV